MPNPQNDTPKPQVMKIHIPGYEDPIEYNMAKVLSAYDAVASQYNINDPQIRGYFNKIINALNSGNAQYGDNGNLQLNSSATSLRNLYDNVDQVDDKYKYDGKARRGVGKSLQSPDDENHGIFTSKKTANFRDDNKKKGQAWAIAKLVLGDANNYFKETPVETTTKPFAGKNLSTYWDTEYKKYNLSGSDLTPDLEKKYRQQIISNLLDTEGALDEFYNKYDWSDTGYTSVDQLRVDLTNLRNALDNGLTWEDPQDLELTSKLGFFTLTDPKKDEAAKRKGTLANFNFDTATDEQIVSKFSSAEEYAAARLAAQLSKNPNFTLEQQNALKENYKRKWNDIHNKYLDTTIYNDQDDFDFNNAYQRYISSSPQEEPNIIYTNDNSQEVQEAYGHLQKFLKHKPGEFIWDAGKAAEKLRNLMQNPEIPKKALASWLQLWYEYSKDIASNERTRRFNNDSIETFNEFLNGKTINNADGSIKYFVIENVNLNNADSINTDGAQMPWYLVYDPVKHKYKYISEAEIENTLNNNENYHQTIRRDSFVKSRRKQRVEQAQVNKNGGILQFQTGGSFGMGNPNGLDDFEAFVANKKQEVAMKAANKSGQGPGRVIHLNGDLGDSTIKTPYGDFQVGDFNGADLTRSIAFVADLASLFLPSLGSGAVGLASTVASMGADLADGIDLWTTTRRNAPGAIMDILSFIPVAGNAAKAAKIGKVLKNSKMMNSIRKGLYVAMISNGLYDLATSEFINHITSPSEWTADDASQIMGLMSALWGAKSGAKIGNGGPMSQKGLLPGNKVRPYSTDNPSLMSYRPKGGTAYYRRLIKGQEVNIPEDKMEALMNARSAKDQQAILRTITDAKTGKPIPEELIQAVNKDSHWFNPLTNFSRSDVYNPDEISLKSIMNPFSRKGPMHYHDNDFDLNGNLVKKAPVEPPAEAPTVQSKTNTSTSVETPKANTPTTNIEGMEVSSAPTPLGGNVITYSPKSTTPAASAPVTSTSAAPATTPSTPTPVSEGITVFSPKPEPEIIINSPSTPTVSTTTTGNTSKSSKRTLRYDKTTMGRRIKNGTATPKEKEAFIKRVQSFKPEINPDDDIATIIKGLNNKQKKKLGVNRKGGILKFSPGGTMPEDWIYGKQEKLAGVDAKYPEDPSQYQLWKNSQYGTDSQSSMNIHLTPTTAENRWKLNSAYTAAENKANRQADFEKAIKFLAKADPKQIEEAYNLGMKTIRDRGMNPNLTYGMLGQKDANETWNAFFDSRAVNFKTNPDLIDQMGPHSWFRIGDTYADELDKSNYSNLDENRLLTWKDAANKEWYFYKMANGDVTLLDDSLYNKWKTSKTTKPSDDADDPTKKDKTDGKDDKEEGKDPIVVAGELSDVDLTGQNPGKDKAFRWDRLTELTRMAGALRANRDAFQVLTNYRPLLNTPYSTYSMVHGDLWSKVRGEQGKAQAISSANQNVTSDASLNLANKSQQTLNGNLLYMQGAKADQDMYYQTMKEAQQHMNDNLGRENAIFNQNIATINADRKEKANLKANYIQNRWDNIDNYLAGYSKELQNEFAQTRNTNKEAINAQADAALHALYVNYINKEISSEKYRQKVEEIGKWRRNEIMGQYGYHNLWYTGAPKYDKSILFPTLKEKSGGRISYRYKRRTTEAGASDFNKAIESSKKAFYNAVQFNHKNRKK